MTPLLLHLPHDATAIPPAERRDFLLSEAELRAESLQLTDWHTGDLYAKGIAPDDVLRAEVSRLVVDVERFADDQLERCSLVGMGATYVRTCDGRPLRSLSPGRRAELLDHYYWPHHRRLDEAAAERLARFGPRIDLPQQSAVLDVRRRPDRILQLQAVGQAAQGQIGIP